MNTFLIVGECCFNVSVSNTPATSRRISLDQANQSKAWATSGSDVQPKSLLSSDPHSCGSEPVLILSPHMGHMYMISRHQIKHVNLSPIWLTQNPCEHLDSVCLEISCSKRGMSRYVIKNPSSSLYVTLMGKYDNLWHLHMKNWRHVKRVYAYGQGSLSSQRNFNSYLNIFKVCQIHLLDTLGDNRFMPLG